MSNEEEIPTLIPPRRPLSAFHLFFKEQRAEIEASLDANNADADADGAEAKKERKRKDVEPISTRHSFLEFSRLIGAAWRSLNKSQRSIYEIKCAEDRERYERELIKYEHELDTQLSAFLCTDDSIPVENDQSNHAADSDLSFADILQNAIALNRIEAQDAFGEATLDQQRTKRPCAEDKLFSSDIHSELLHDMHFSQVLNSKRLTSPLDIKINLDAAHDYCIPKEKLSKSLDAELPTFSRPDDTLDNLAFLQEHIYDNPCT